MNERDHPEETHGPRRRADLPDPGEPAHRCYKARLTKGLLGVDLGEGPIVEILNYRTKRVPRRDLFDDPDEARDALESVRHDIGTLTVGEFRDKYLKPPA